MREKEREEIVCLHTYPHTYMYTHAHTFTRGMYMFINQFYRQRGVYTITCVCTRAHVSKGILI